jgi:hypothetical protein
VEKKRRGTENRVVLSQVNEKNHRLTGLFDVHVKQKRRLDEDHFGIPLKCIVDLNKYKRS